MTDISREDALAHFGVKGMRWGVRNDRSTKRTPEERKALAKKVAIGAGATTLALGVTYAGYVLAKNAKAETDLWNEATRATASTGAKAAKQLSNTDAFKKMLKDFDADLADAHKNETTWMRNNVPNYNPRTNPYIPKYELKRINNG